MTYIFYNFKFGIKVANPMLSENDDNWYINDAHNWDLLKYDNYFWDFLKEITELSVFKQILIL